MNTIGKYLKDTRLSQNKTLEDMENKTKIRKEFVRLIENESWNKLPDFPVVTGFVKSIAGALKLDEKKVLAFLRRDYPPRNVSLNPKADILNRFVWSPKLTFFLGIFAVTVAIVGYLGFQYYDFTRSPSLEVYSPSENLKITESTVSVSGKTDPEAVVRVNNQPVIVGENGEFATQIEIFSQTKEILIKSVSRSGKETAISRKVSPELSN
ncbi:helix-turn-helix domain-containing protein [Candidatus Woesebacteria bacterium]|nr:MAG: helix-turn-helix domain-containing protein [Candidatus Woesebacteria bacterium]